MNERRFNISFVLEKCWLKLKPLEHFVQHFLPKRWRTLSGSKMNFRIFRLLAVVETVLTARPPGTQYCFHFQHLPNIRSTVVERMLGKMLNWTGLNPKTEHFGLEKLRITETERQFRKESTHCLN